MNARESLLDKFDNYLWKQLKKVREELPDLNMTNPKSFKTLREEEIMREFEEYERRHFVVKNEVYLSMMGCVEAYKPPLTRATFLDNETSYDGRVSNDRIAVYFRGLYAFQELFICVHGTKLTSLEDIYQDVQVIENSIQNSAFTIKYIHDIINIRNKFPGIADDNVYISGHSLASIYSLLSSKVLNVNGLGFNGAAALLNIQVLSSMDILGASYNLKNIESYSNFTAFRIPGDPVSLLSKWALKNVITVDVSGLDKLTAFQLHSMKTFLDTCVPMIPLDNSSRSNARRSGKLDDSRDQIKKEGQYFDLLRKQVVSPEGDDFLKYLVPFNF